MSQIDIKQFLREQLEFGGKSYAQDLEALTDEQVSESPNGTGRKAIDYTYEVVFFNRMVAARMRGETPPAWPWESWATAPEGYTRQQAIDDIRASVKEIVDAYHKVDMDTFLTKIDLPEGRSTSRLEGVSYAIQHMAHHDGQLNQLQSLHGDLGMHWD